MRALELDFIVPPKNGSWVGAIALLAAALAVFELLSVHSDLERESDSLSQEMRKLERQARGLSVNTARVNEATAQEIQQANAVIDQLALPWDRLFRAVESAASDKVVLLGIAPDARAGTVQISGETTDPDAMIDYVGRLQRQTDLTGVYLLSHQREPRNAVRPYRFTVTASWLGSPQR